MSRLVVFDCDGTLVDGQAAICETMELAFRNTGRPIIGTPLPTSHGINRVLWVPPPFFVLLPLFSGGAAPKAP